MKRERTFGLGMVLCMVAGCGGGGPSSSEKLSALSAADAKTVCLQIISDEQFSNSVLSGECASSLSANGGTSASCSAGLSDCVSSAQANAKTNSDPTQCDDAATMVVGCDATVGDLDGCFSALKSYINKTYGSSTCSNPAPEPTSDPTTSITQCQTLMTLCPNFFSSSN